MKKENFASCKLMINSFFFLINLSPKFIEIINKLS